MKENSSIVVTDFSGIYQDAGFLQGENVSWISLRDLPGTNCYCDDEAKARLEKLLEEFSFEGIHFIDSGNYHYMSRLWAGKIQEPFQMLVLDNHTDMQPPAFGGLLSCGGWIEAALRELPELKRVILVGPDEKAWEMLDPEGKEKVVFRSREILAQARKQPGGLEIVIRGCMEGENSDLPLYISVDKDVLKPGEAYTSWSQGDMSLDEMLGILETAEAYVRSGGGRLLGADICGECDLDMSGVQGVNDAANRKLLTFFKEKGV